MKVATSTSTSSAAPWSGRSRSSTACESPIPSQRIPSSVIAIEVVTRSWDSRAAAKAKISGKLAARTSRIWKADP